MAEIGNKVMTLLCDPIKPVPGRQFHRCDTCHSSGIGLDLTYTDAHTSRCLHAMHMVMTCLCADDNIMARPRVVNVIVKVPNETKFTKVRTIHSVLMWCKCVCGEWRTGNRTGPWVMKCIRTASTPVREWECSGSSDEKTIILYLCLALADDDIWYGFWPDLTLQGPAPQINCGEAFHYAGQTQSILPVRRSTLHRSTFDNGIEIWFGVLQEYK
jgi:hypothetical protein